MRGAWPLLFIILLAAPPSATAAELKQETVAAFEDYIREAEARIQQRVGGEKSFLWVEESADRKVQLRRGEVVIDALVEDGMMKAPGGMIHDWIGAAFIPGTTLEGTLAVVQDYDNHKNIYQPEVMDSKLLHRNGNDFKIYYRLLKKKIITVVLNTEHDARYFPLDEKCWHSRSYSTRIAELKDPGKPGESEIPAGNDHGFLWRLYSYWRFQERDGGVYIECEAISLTRGIPTGLGWLIEPVVRDLPRESLTATLGKTRAALVK